MKSAGYGALHTLRGFRYSSPLRGFLVWLRLWRAGAQWSLVLTTSQRTISIAEIFDGWEALHQQVGGDQRIQLCEKIQI